MHPLTFMIKPVYKLYCQPVHIPNYSITKELDECSDIII